MLGVGLVDRPAWLGSMSAGEPSIRIGRRGRCGWFLAMGLAVVATVVLLFHYRASSSGGHVFKQLHGFHARYDTPTVWVAAEFAFMEGQDLLVPLVIEPCGRSVHSLDFGFYTLSDPSVVSDYIMFDSPKIEYITPEPLQEPAQHFCTLVVTGAAGLDRVEILPMQQSIIWSRDHDGEQLPGEELDLVGAVVHVPR